MRSVGRVGSGEGVLRHGVMVLLKVVIVEGRLNWGEVIDRLK
jgi:hypothetical protein